jgi:hypothetical protein
MLCSPSRGWSSEANRETPIKERLDNEVIKIDDYFTVCVTDLD